MEKKGEKLFTLSLGKSRLSTDVNNNELSEIKSLKKKYEPQF